MTFYRLGDRYRIEEFHLGAERVYTIDKVHSIYLETELPCCYFINGQKGTFFFDPAEDDDPHTAPWFGPN